MHGGVCRVLSGFAVIALAMPLMGQSTAGQKTVPCPVNPPKPRAYTAELRITSAQTLADGTTITGESKEVRARDSQGRYMNANSGFMFSGGRTDVTRVNVNDPVEGTQTNWDSLSRKATVTKMPPADQRQGCWADEAGHFRVNYGSRSPRSPAPPKSGSGGGASGAMATMPPGPIPRPMPQNQNREDLGTATIMGIEAHGYRNSFTTPVGEIGNDRPLVRTSEYWGAAGFDFPLRQVDSDPRTGTRTTELVSLDQSEPDPAIFQPHEGYEVVIVELHEVPCQQGPQ